MELKKQQATPVCLKHPPEFRAVFREKRRMAAFETVKKTGWPSRSTGDKDRPVIRQFKRSQNGSHALPSGKTRCNPAVRKGNRTIDAACPLPRHPAGRSNPYGCAGLLHAAGAQ
jgi:hypothetical protein